MRCVKVKVEIWSDFTCPFCYMGKRKFEMALEQFTNKQFVQVQYKSYQLDPHAEHETNVQVRTMIMNKYNFSAEKTTKMMEQISREAASIDLELNFDSLVHTNTFHAHRLVKLAEKYGKDKLIIDLLFDKYFAKGKNIGKKSILLSIAKEAGLQQEEVDSLLCLNQFAKVVAEDEDIAKEIGINGVPFYVFNEQYAISGAQPVSVFVNVLEKVWKMSKDQPESRRSVNTGKSSYCVGDDCDN